SRLPLNNQIECQILRKTEILWGGTRLTFFVFKHFPHRAVRYSLPCSTFRPFRICEIDITHPVYLANWLVRVSTFLCCCSTNTSVSPGKSPTLPPWANTAPSMAMESKFCSDINTSHSTI